MLAGLTSFLLLQAAAPQPAAPPGDEAGKRVELNLLGKTDAAAGESRRNENIQFNLVDNNALKELNLRLGISATIVETFRPERNYFSAEFGNAAQGPPHVAPALKAPWHGTANWAHLNSILSARSFFQVGGVQPARENDYGFSAGGPLSKRWSLQIDGSQQKLRGQVNGNVLVPKPDERTPLSSTPAVRTLVARFLTAYPLVLPNRIDINERALNTNAPQVIDNNNAGIRIDNSATDRDRVVAQYQFTSQAVDAFQLVAGQNPDTDTKNHRARLTWNRAWSAATVSNFTAGFDRIRSLLRPEPNAVGPMVSIAGLTTLGPLGAIPIDRAQNLFRYAGQMRQTLRALE